MGINMKVVLAFLLLVAAASAAPWGVLPYSAGVLPYTAAVAPVSGSAIPVDGGWPYTDALGFSTGLQNAGARVPITYGAGIAPLTYSGAFPYTGLPISTTIVKA